MGSSNPHSDQADTGLQHVITQQEEAYEQRKKKWFLDVEHTPCARAALIHGILGGLAVGLIYFAKSNIVRRSCDLAVGGFAVTSLTSWEICRYQKAKQRSEVKRTVNILNSLNRRMGSPPGTSATGWQLPNDSIPDSNDNSMTSSKDTNSVDP